LEAALTGRQDAGRQSPLPGAKLRLGHDSKQKQNHLETRNISELCKSLTYRHSLKNAGEDILAMFFTVEYDFDSMSIDLSGRNFAKIIAKDSGWK
jgi:hypothetical protein